MKSLWAPWRMTYIQETVSPGTGCIFEAGAGKKHEKESLLLYRDDSVVVLLNRYPYTNGHLLVAPNRHVGYLDDLLPEEGAGLFAMIQKAITILRKYKKPDGFNVGLNLGSVAGAGQADHIHFHIVPRWQGDHNFMPVVAEVKMIPEHLENTFDQLLPDFQELHAG